MTKEEKKEYIENIFQLVLTGEGENYALAETLIESLNLYDDFENHLLDNHKRMRGKISFLSYSNVSEAERRKELVIKMFRIECFRKLKNLKSPA
jgi:hypothetical protein